MYLLVFRLDRTINGKREQWTRAYLCRATRTIAEIIRELDGIIGHSDSAFVAYNLGGKHHMTIYQCRGKYMELNANGAILEVTY